MYYWVTASICSLEAVRAEAGFVIGRAFAVSAPAAGVFPALDIRERPMHCSASWVEVGLRQAEQAQNVEPLGYG